MSKSLQVKHYIVDEIFFTKGFAVDGGPYLCTAACCEGGVYADVRERDRIMAHREMVKKYMDETQTTDDSLWFEQEEQDDTDFASGRCIGTREINGKCAFLDRKGRCVLQVAAVAEGMDRWALKPLFCVLYPVEVTGRTIGFDDMLQEEHPCCSVTENFRTPLFEGCRDELIYLLGEDGYKRIEKHYMSLQSATGRNR